MQNGPKAGTKKACSATVLSKSLPAKCTVESVGVVGENLRFATGSEINRTAIAWISPSTRTVQVLEGRVPWTR
jgi:hypothetical protein